MIADIAGQKIHEHAGLGEGPGLAAAPAPQNGAEQFFRLLPIEKMRLVRRALIGVARREGHAVDAERRGVVEEFRDALGIGVGEEGAVRRDPEALRLCELDRLDGAFVDAFLADRVIVHLLVAVEMDRPGEIGARLEEIDLLRQQKRVGANDREFLSRDDALDDLREILVQQRFATRDDDDRRPAFVDRGQSVLHREALVEDVIGIVDLAASGAGEIAAKQRLHHEHERITLHAHQVLLDEVGADPGDVTEGNSQGFFLLCGARLQGTARQKGSMLGRLLCSAPMWPSTTKAP